MQHASDAEAVALEVWKFRIVFCNDFDAHGDLFFGECVHDPQVMSS